MEDMLFLLHDLLPNVQEWGLGIHLSNSHQLEESTDTWSDDVVPILNHNNAVYLRRSSNLSNLGFLAKCAGREHLVSTPEADTNDNHQQEESNAGPVVNSVNTTSCSRDEDPLEILEHVKINNPLESPISTIKGVFKDSKEEDLSFNKPELRKVEERLRHVFIEFYHKLRLLKHYRW